MFAAFDSADASGRILCLWWCGFEKRLLKGLHCFSSLPLSFLVAIQRFISTDISRFEDVDVRFTPEDAFQTVSLLTASLIYCSCH